jgi:hypothetical protein
MATVCPSASRSCGVNSLEDVLIPGTAAGIAGNALANVPLCGMGTLLQQLHGAHEKTGCAISTLESVAVAESLLHGMKLAIFSQTFDCEHFTTVGLKGEYRA